MNTSATLILISGAAIRVTNPFIMGAGIAGDISDGTTRWFSDSDISEVRQ